MRTAFLASLLATVTTALCGVALAAPPDHFTDSFDYSSGDPGVQPTRCGTFDDLWVGHLDVHGLTKFDKQGNPVVDIVHFSGWETNYRSDDTSIRFTAKRQFTVIYDYAANTERDIGMVFSVNAPGLGNLFHDVGNIKFDDSTGEPVFVHGPHDVFAQGDAAFCNALIAIS